MVLAAGSANRMNLNINKVYLSLNSFSIPALHYPLAALEINRYVDEIVIAVKEEDRDIISDMIIHEKFPKKPVWIVRGGKNRYDSVYNSLQQASGDIVIVHDGARPLLKQKYINDCIEIMDKEVGATVAIPMTDTSWTVDESGFLAEKIDHTVMFRIQTPQCFHTKVLRECHERVLDKSDITDDTTLLERCGYRVKLLSGGESNVKLTYQTDIISAEHYILNDEEIFNLL